MADKGIHSDVQQYYSENICSKDDVKTTVNCCLQQNAKMKEYTKLIHEAVKNKYYGCGLVAPEHLQGLHILDLGCGAGMDCFMLSKLAGPTSHITGVDMTDDQLNTAREYIEYHRQTFGYEKANTEFIKGYIEDLQAAGIPDHSQDVVVSNCVVNLTSDKRKTLEEVYRVLKVGGEFYFSDYYADQTIPESLQQNKVLWGECISGALYWKQLFDLAEDIGFCRPLQVEASPIVIDDPKLVPLLEGYQFVSVTYRLFKCSEKKRTGSVSATYTGGIDHAEDSFQLASPFEFKKDVASVVPVEIGQILRESRFRAYFKMDKESDVSCEVDLKMNPFEATTSSSQKAGCCAK